MILGIDEVGRGPWAGPLVVGAVVLGEHTIEGLTDSKKLSDKKRRELAELISTPADAVGLGWVYSAEIDEVGLSRALVLATMRAVEQISVPYHEIIIDGTVNFLRDTSKGQYVTTLKKADLLIPSVSAASIVAKVARDTYMTELAAEYPDYGFENHVGYGTAQHTQAIERHGVTPLHRLSIKPLVKYAKKPTTTQKPTYRGTTFAGSTKGVGDRAEEVVAEYLRAHGHEVIERNWKTKFCEIDIVSRKGDTVYFTEVKYRKNSEHGGGLAAITPKKLRQMKFAAEYYMLKYGVTHQPLLASADVASDEYEMMSWLVIT